MTDKQSDAPLTEGEIDEANRDYDESEVIQPEPIEDVDTGLQGYTNPVTAPNADPAAMSETERNRRLAESYDPPLSEQREQ